MSATGGEGVGSLLEEQRASYRAVAADYLDQGLDLPGDELTQALDALPADRQRARACLRRPASAASRCVSSFWSLVADCLNPAGRVFFADDAYRTPDELVEGPSSSTIRRRIPEGTAYRLVKVPYQPADLERRLRQLGWRIKVTSTAGPFYWGAGTRGGG